MERKWKCTPAAAATGRKKESEIASKGEIGYLTYSPSFWHRILEETSSSFFDLWETTPILRGKQPSMKFISSGGDKLGVHSSPLPSRNKKRVLPPFLLIALFWRSVHTSSPPHFLDPPDVIFASSPPLLCV